MRSRLPTENEINVFGSLDEQTAVENFFGKDLAQAEALFRENFLYYQEGLMWMGPVAFCFYVHSALNYLCGPDSQGDVSDARVFCSVIEFRMEHEPELIARVAPALCDAIVKMLAKFERFDCEVHVGGDMELESRYRRLLERLNNPGLPMHTGNTPGKSSG